MNITKTRINKVYRSHKLLHATYHGDTWTTNTYIAERGKIEPRVYKDTVDYRGNASKMPALESIIDNPVTVESVTACVEGGGRSIVTTDSYNYFYNTEYVSYLVDKYGIDNLLLEPLGKTSRMFASDGDGRVMAVLMGERS
jgi:hypothetical protein